MNKFTYILPFIAITALLFTGCYTQLTTQEGGYSERVTHEIYSSNQQSAQQGRDAYTDTSENYTGDYYDTTGYFSKYGEYNSYYYDDFYYSYPSYRRYFWGYYPSISIGFSWGWGGWYYPYYYSPYYCGFWYGWWYPTWGYSCFSYYYPAPYYYGYNSCYYGWNYPKYPYYTTRERRRDIARIRNLDGLRGGGGRSTLIGSRTESSGRNLNERRRDDLRVSSVTGSSTTARVDPVRDMKKVNRSDREGLKTSRNAVDQVSRRAAERKLTIADGNRGRISTGIKTRNLADGNNRGSVKRTERSASVPSVKGRNEVRSSNGNIRPRSYTPPSVEYKPQRRTNTPNNFIPPSRNNTPRGYVQPKRNNDSRSYTPPKRNNTSRSYTPPKRNNTSRSYTPPKRNNTSRSYTPPKRNNTPRSYTPPRSYSPPQRSSSPPSRGSGSRSGGSSSGRSRR